MAFINSSLASTTSLMGVTNFTRSVTKGVTSVYFSTTEDYYGGGHDITDEYGNDVTNAPGGGDGDYIYDPYYGYEDYENLTDLDEYFYEGFHFERTVYVYLWEALVILTSLANILIMAVLMRKNMRNSTNTILIAIAVTDSLTGIVTMPATIYAYQMQNEHGHLILTEVTCELFMLSKFYFSKTFHTMSIWLTLILGIQRLVSVSFPFKAQRMFTIPKTIIIIVVVVILAPCLHMYHVFNRKAIDGKCTWRLEEPCDGSCVHLWFIFYLMHFTPCVILVICTIIMVFKLIKTTAKMQDSHMISNKENLDRRTSESRRISAVVIAVVVVFLIPEIPYGAFLLMVVILKHSRMDIMDLKTNRTFHCVYDILLVLSFHANFWIYLVMNRKFRKGLQDIFLPCLNCVNSLLFKMGITSSFQGRRRSNDHSAVKTQHSELHSRTSAVEMKIYKFDGQGNGKGNDSHS